MSDAEQTANAYRAAWTMIDLYGLDEAVKITDNAITHYTRQAADHTTHPIWPLENLRVALAEIEAQRGTAAGMLAVSGQVRAHEGLNAAEEYDRAAGTLTTEVKNRYRAQRYWVDRIAEKRCGFCGLTGHAAHEHATPPNLEG